MSALSEWRLSKAQVLEYLLMSTSWQFIKMHTCIFFPKISFKVNLKLQLFLEKKVPYLLIRSFWSSVLHQGMHFLCDDVNYLPWYTDIPTVSVNSLCLVDINHLSNLPRTFLPRFTSTFVILPLTCLPFNCEPSPDNDGAYLL